MTYSRAKLKSMLSKNICGVTFTKVDGSKRTLTCTLKKDLLPEKTTSNVTRKPIRGVLPVFETELGEWRSFRIGSVKTVKVL